MIYWFAIFFSFFVLILTLLADLKILLIIYFCCLAVFFIFKVSIKYIAVLIFSIILALLSVYYYNYKYFQNCDIKDRNFISTGFFVNRLIADKYIFDNSGKNFYTKVENFTPDIGRQYLVAGYFKSVSFQTGWQNIVSYFTNPSYRFDKYLFMKGYCGKLNIVNKMVMSGYYHYSIFDKTKNFIRKKVVDLYGSGENGSLLLGMLVGDKSFMTDRQYRQYIDSQIVHIVAVSGGNLALVGFLVSLLLFWLPFYIRLFFVFLGISFFVFMVGADSSVIRAWIMASLMIIALYFGKSILVWRLVAIALILMLLYNPYFLPYDLGFLLSFGAFIGIVIFNEILDKFRIKYEKFYDKLRKNFVGRALYKSFREYILPTIGATVGVLPILLLFVGKINLLGMLANFLVVFLVPVVSILGIFTLFFPIDILIWLENKFLSYINFISYWFSKHQINLYIKGWPIKLFIFVLVYLVLAVLYFYFTKRFLKDE